MAVTYQGQYQAVVKEASAGEPIIVFQLVDGDPIPDLRGEVIGIHMEAGTSVEEVQEIADAINKRMSSFFLTSFKV
ncbi:MAG: hypothetical protein WAL92_12660 [Thiogranum sp.]|jgi:hypothetical protein